MYISALFYRHLTLLPSQATPGTLQAEQWPSYLFLKYTDQFGNNFDKNPGIHKKKDTGQGETALQGLATTKDKSHDYTENGREDNGSGPGLLAGFGSKILSTSIPNPYRPPY
jgi:hypothetical protein